MPIRFSFFPVLATSLLALPVLIPGVVILSALLFGDGEVWNHLVSTVLMKYIVNTIVLIVLVSIVSVTLGVGTAWLTSIFQFPGSRWLPIALVLPLAIPSYVVGYVYADLLEYSGTLQTWLRDNARIESLPAIRSLPGASLVIGFVLYPYIFMLARTNFLGQSATLGEAGRSLGLTQAKFFFRVALPLARPAVIGGLALVLMETVADYGVVSHFGVPTFTTGIFRAWFAMGDVQAALQLAGCLFVIAAVLLVFEDLGRRGQFFNPVSRDRPSAFITLTGWRSWIAVAACAIPILIGFVIPVLVLVMHAYEAGDGLGLSRLTTYAANSFQVGFLAAIFCLLATVILSYSIRVYRLLPLRVGARIATLGYALPGMMLAVGLLFPLGWLDRTIATYVLENFDTNVGMIVTGSIGGLLLVYVARFTTVSYNSLNAGLLQINQRYDDAARSMGAGNFSLFRRVHFPLLKPALATGLVLVFIDVVKELPATLILRPFNFETLATRVYRLASDERLSEASTAALLIVALALIPTLMLVKQSRSYWAPSGR